VRQVVPDGLDLTGSTRALVSGWLREVNGGWLACPPGLKLTVDRWFWLIATTAVTRSLSTY
jgi:hypothetical protein